MEIIHIILGKANPNRMNGVNKVVYELATKQAKYGRKVSVWGITKDVSHNYGKRNFETKLFKTLLNPFGICVQLKKKLLLKKEATVFHMHGGWVPIYATLSSFFTKHGIPYVLTTHGSYNIIAMNRSKWLKRIYFQLFEKSLLNNARCIHFIGESEIGGVKSIFKLKNFLLMPYGFDITKQNIKNRTKNETDFIIGFLGRLDVYTKGLDILLDAFFKFHKKEPKTQLWIIGNGKDRKEVEQLIQCLNLQNSVRLFGSKFGQDKIDLVQQMDVFVHPSRNEGLPVAVLEACEIGIPCIVSKATNMGSYISKAVAGITINNECVNELTRAMQSMHIKYNTIGLLEYSRNAKKMLRDDFNWEKIVIELDRLYKS